jgi:hypothetical protein
MLALLERWSLDGHLLVLAPVLLLVLALALTQVRAGGCK